MRDRGVGFRRLQFLSRSGTGLVAAYRCHVAFLLVSCRAPAGLSVGRASPRGVSFWFEVLALGNPDAACVVIAAGVVAVLGPLAHDRDRHRWCPQRFTRAPV